eukprot:660481-Hanusia_phi.AAC.1
MLQGSVKLPIEVLAEEQVHLIHEQYRFARFGRFLGDSGSTALTQNINIDLPHVWKLSRKTG